MFLFTPSLDQSSAVDNNDHNCEGTAQGLREDAFPIWHFVWKE